MFLSLLGQLLCSISLTPSHSRKGAVQHKAVWAPATGRSAAGRDCTCRGTTSRPGPALPRRPLPTLWPQRSQSQVQQEGRARFPPGVHSLLRLHMGSGTRQPSKQQSFPLEVIPLPERKAVELFRAHPEHFLELRRRQVSLETEGNSRGGADGNLAAWLQRLQLGPPRGPGQGHRRDAMASCSTPGPPVPQMPSASPSLPLCTRPN